MNIQLRVSTSDIWIDKATSSLECLLSDHAECEKKAAVTAINFTRYFTKNHKVLLQLALIAREEMRHFDRVLHWINALGYTYQPATASSYAKQLHSKVRLHDEGVLDRLLIAAIIEARSCERFFRLVPYLPDTLATFYNKLYEAEKRHAEVYLEFATAWRGANDWQARLDYLLDWEASVITSTDRVFAFHSGVPADAA